MAGVFLSYDREDAEQARHLARALEGAGHEVWWDFHVRGGAQFSKVIEDALRSADAVVVLWSNHSIESAWVRDEAAVGRDSGRLVPVWIDATEPPLGFRQFQTIDLSKWKSRGRPRQFPILVEAINSLAKPTGPPASISTPESHRAAPWRSLTVAGILALMIMAAVVVAVRRLHVQSTPVVRVVAADSSPMSGEIARDLLVKLGSVQSAQRQSLQIADAASGVRDGDLLFEIAGQTMATGPEATLILYQGRNHSLLWSHNFLPPGQNEPDVRKRGSSDQAH